MIDINLSKRSKTQKKIEAKIKNNFFFKNMVGPQKQT
jgi:hypothetical protein